MTHPEATHVRDRLVGGWFDSELTPRGVVDAQRIAEWLHGHGPPGRDVVVVASDLRRTRSTAAVIADRLGAGLRLDVDLREQSYGVAEGHSPGTFPVRPCPVGGDRLHHRDGVRGSETRFEVATRVYRAVDRILAAGAEHAVVVTHGAAATYVVAAWIGMPLDSVGAVRFAVPPGSVTVLREDDERDRRVESVGDTSHLT